MMLTKATLFSAAWIAPALAWNTDGQSTLPVTSRQDLSDADRSQVHNQIGFMAETFFTPKTTSILSQILEPQYNESVGRAAAWADGYAHTAEGRFSYQWHWIDTHDWAPDHCSLNYSQDCAKGGCVVSAIANQTGILKECIGQVNSGALSGGTNLTCSYALKWVAHFLGDIHQPLHASGRAAGGNLYKAVFGNVSTELHAVSGFFAPSRFVHVKLIVNRYGMATFRIMRQTSVSRSRPSLSIPSSPTSYHAYERTSSTRHLTCGSLVATQRHPRSAPQAGRRKVTDGLAIMFTSMQVTVQTWVTMAMLSARFQL